MALLVTLSGSLIIVGATLRWPYWSPAFGQNGVALTVGSGPSELELVALGPMISLMGFQAPLRSSLWHYAGLTVASLTTTIFALFIASARLAVVNKGGRRLDQPVLWRRIGLRDAERPSAGRSLALHECGDRGARVLVGTPVSISPRLELPFRIEIAA